MTCDLLSYLDVRIPNVPNEPIEPKSIEPSNFHFLRYSHRPPIPRSARDESRKQVPLMAAALPAHDAAMMRDLCGKAKESDQLHFRLADSEPRRRCHSSVTPSEASTPTASLIAAQPSEVIRRRCPRTGVEEEVLVFESAVPSLAVANKVAAEHSKQRRREEIESRKEAERREALVEHQRRSQESTEQRRRRDSAVVTQREFLSLQERQKWEASQKTLEREQKEQEIYARAAEYEREAERRKAAEQQRRNELWATDLRQMMEEKQHRKKQADPAPGNTSLLMANSGAVPPAAAHQLAMRARDEIVHSWQAQVEAKEEKARSDRLNNSMLDKMMIDQANAEIDIERSRKEMNKRALQSHREFLERQIEATRQAKLAVRDVELAEGRAAQVSLQRTHSKEVTRSKAAQERVKAELKRDLTLQVARARAAAAEKGRGEKAAPPVEPLRKVVLRCPVSGRLLPPAAFGITATHT